jgi:hypothetical protein
LLRLALIAVALFLVATGLRRLARRGLPPEYGHGRWMRPAAGPAGESGELMLRDPQCGRFIAAREGIVLSRPRGEEPLYFCSPECRALYLESAQPSAATAATKSGKR